MILHGLFLCITSFVAGVILTWLFFAWRMDRGDNYMTDLLMKSYRENERLNSEWLHGTRLIFTLESQAMQHRDNQIKATESIKMLTEELLKYKPQEKQQCQE